MDKILFETGLAKLAYFPNEKLLLVEVKDNGDYSLDCTKETYKLIYSVKGEEKIMVLVDGRKVSYDYFPKESFNYISNNEYLKYQKKIAIILNGVGLNLLGNFYLNFYKPKVSTKIFKAINGALKWLEIENTKEITKELESTLQHTN